MNCKQCQKLFFLNKERVLTEKQKSNMHQHIEQCQICKQAIQTTQSVLNAVSQLQSEHVSKDVLQAIRKKADQHLTEQKQGINLRVLKTFRSMPRLAYALGSIAVIMFVVSVFFFPKEQKQSKLFVDARFSVQLSDKLIEQDFARLEKLIKRAPEKNIVEGLEQTFSLMKKTLASLENVSTDYDISFTLKEQTIDDRLQKLEQSVSVKI